MKKKQQRIRKFSIFVEERQVSAYSNVSTQNNNTKQQHKTTTQNNNTKTTQQKQRNNNQNENHKSNYQL